MLADEPTGNLDSSASEEVFALFRSLHERENTTFLIVTHDARPAARCDRVITLVDGHITSGVRRADTIGLPGVGG